VADSVAAAKQRAASVIVAALAVAALAAGRGHEPAREPMRALVTHSAAARALRDGERVELNAASAAELTLLPGVGPKLAQRILDERARLGGFRSLQDLDAVSGIGPATLARLAPLVRVTPSATATDRTAASPTR
jgi:competence protein ComEA